MATLKHPPTQNGLQKTLGSILTAGTTSAMTLNNVTGVQNKPGVVVINRINISGVELATSVREWVSYTGVSGSTLTGLTRSLGGSTDQDHGVGSVVEFVPDVTVFQSICDVIEEEHNTNGTHTGITTDTITTSGLANMNSMAIASGTAMTSVKDEDDMVSNSAVALATQQSIKAYVDAQVATVTNTNVGIMVGTDNGAISSGQTLYTYVPGILSSTNATETNRQTAFPAGTAKRLIFNITANSLNGNLILTIRKNAADTTITKTVSAGATGVQSVAADVSVADEDKLSLEIDTTAAGSGSVTIHSPAFLFNTT